jgi:4-carboxymuconolactone decarboxylase
MARLHFDPEQLDPKDKSIYDEMVAQRRSQGAPFGGPYAALMNHPALCQKIEALGYYLKFQGHLPRAVYQFIVLAVARETKTDFEWNDHIDHALAAGVPQAVLEELKTHGVREIEFPVPFHVAAQVLQSSLIWQNIPDQVQADATAEYGLPGFIEIVVLSGFYQMFSAINQGFDVSRSGNTRAPLSYGHDG